jgi:hypothetical protein
VLRWVGKNTTALEEPMKEEALKAKVLNPGMEK